MSSPYQDFVRKAKERFEARQKKKSTGLYHFTEHSRFKMKQYGLSEQRIRSVIRNPKRTEEGIMPRTAAMMQPVSLKRVNGKDVWKQEIWVMVMRNAKIQSPKSVSRILTINYNLPTVKIISAWRYPGVSPKRNPVPDEILQELADGSILEEAS